MEQEQHAFLFFTVKQHCSESAGIVVEIGGCKDCLINSLAIIIAENAKFRELINRAGVRANRIRKGEALD